jgi:hypothetical protein
MNEFSHRMTADMPIILLKTVEFMGHTIGLLLDLTLLIVRTFARGIMNLSLEKYLLEYALDLATAIKRNIKICIKTLEYNHAP